MFERNLRLIQKGKDVFNRVIARYEAISAIANQLNPNIIVCFKNSGGYSLHIHQLPDLYSLKIASFLAMTECE
jgi:hypothetical protein